MKAETKMPEAMKPHDFWQEILPPGSLSLPEGFTDFYPAVLADGRQLVLPIRQLPHSHHAVASLIINQASFAVQAALADDLAERLTPYAPDIVVGLPTLGLTLAAAVAPRLGHGRYVPFGTSRKFWYLDELSVPLSSITAPDHQKRLHVDPRMLPLLQGARVALVDDVISSGASMLAGLRLLAAIGVEPVVLGVAMVQTDRWHHRIAEFGAHLPECVVGALHTPMFDRMDDGRWKIEAPSAHR